ncbi:MAG: RNA polymerase sigma factor [Actinomycetota bacterium]|nr:RNA polymerase sigma factor [Actinomycetota bacterium]
MSEPASAVASDTGPDVSGRSSFEDFFSEQHRGLYGALVLVTRSSHEAEEVMQDAFLRVWERWDRVSAVEDPVGYLYRTAMNVFRSRRRRVLVALRRTVRPREPDDGLAAVEDREAVVRALAPLTPGQRAAIVLTDVLGFTSEEAGRALRVRPVTVRVLASRGRAALRKEMTERG